MYTVHVYVVRETLQEVNIAQPHGNPTSKEVKS